MFDDALRFVLAQEGGLVDHADDPGGLTKWGISQRVYPGEDIRSLTRQRAGEIYRRDYWDKVRGDDLPGPVAFLAFDFAVNAGVSRATRTLQTCLAVTADGIIGPVTLAAAERVPDTLFILDFTLAKLRHYASLPSFNTFGRGWTRRAIAAAEEAAHA